MALRRTAEYFLLAANSRAESVTSRCSGEAIARIVTKKFCQRTILSHPTTIAITRASSLLAPAGVYLNFIALIASLEEPNGSDKSSSSPAGKLTGFMSRMRRRGKSCGALGDTFGDGQRRLVEALLRFSDTLRLASGGVTANGGAVGGGLPNPSRMMLVTFVLADS